MAATINRFSCIALRHTSRIPSRRKRNLLAQSIRQLHASPLYHAEAEDPSNPSKPTRKPFKFSYFDLSHDERAAYRSLSPSEQQQWQDEAKQMHDYMTSPSTEQDLSASVAQAIYETTEESPHVPVERQRIKPGLFAMGEVDKEDSGEDEAFEGDDITSLGHAELEQHREMREYARIAAWEMPLLSKLATPFKPPQSTHPLRFRYTTYMGETHPASQKIVLEFCTRDLLAPLSSAALTEPQRIKLIKLVGPRYNPSTDVVKMSSEMFETQAQNKRYLGDLVDQLIEEARDEKDTFEDVPLDFRHHKSKTVYEFPEWWKMNARRKNALGRRRRRQALKSGEREVVSGERIIEEAMQKVPVMAEAVAERQQIKRGGSGMERVRGLR